MTDEYIGSPMLSALYPTWVAWTGDRRRSLRFLDDGYAAFTSPRFMKALDTETAWSSKPPGLLRRSMT